MGERVPRGGAGGVGEQRPTGLVRLYGGALGARRSKTWSGWYHVPLVELVVAGDEHGERLCWASRPARPACCHIEAIRAGEAVEDAGIEPADVDAELDRGGGDDAQPPGEQVGARVSGSTRNDTAGERTPGAVNDGRPPARVRLYASAAALVMRDPSTSNTNSSSRSMSPPSGVSAVTRYRSGSIVRASTARRARLVMACSSAAVPWA